jgi:O-antigen/teichoic acid export membrane protein
MIFEKTLFKKHFNFGYKLTLSGLLNTLFDNIYPVMIGKFFSAAQLGFYTRADSLKQLPVNNFASVFNNVAFPLLSEVQNDKPRFKATVQKIIKLSVFVIAPVLFIMAALAEPLFSFLFTEKWDAAVPYFQILVISGVLYPIHMYNLTVLNVLGRSDLFLKLEVIKKIMIIAGIGMAWQWGVTGLLWASVAVSAAAWVVNTHYTKIFIQYSLFEQIKDVAPVLIYVGLASMTSLGLDMWMTSLGWSNASRLLLAGIAGFIIYLSLAQIFRLSSYYEVRSILRTSLRKYLFSKTPQQ